MQYPKNEELNPEQKEQREEFNGRDRSDLHDRVNTDIKPTKGDRILDCFIIGILVIVAIVAFYPLYLVLICSVSDPAYISTGDVWIIPRGLNFAGYKVLLDTKEIWLGYRNSLFYTIVGTTLQMIVTTAAGFAISRKTLPGRRFLMLFFLFPLYFSGGMIPTYLVIKETGMINTVWALIVPVLVGHYNLVLARNYYENSIPEELYESASVDGANIIRYFFQFAIPLSVPVLAVMVLNFALGHWNKYFDAMIYISDDSIQTLQVFIKRITMQATSSLEGGGGDTQAMIEQVRQKQLLKYAVVIVSSVPMIMLYPLIQKYFVHGIMMGAVKG